MKDILVSILVPIYGVEKYIARCAHSLFCQTYDNIEYVFVNDCTKDNSISILSSIIKDYPNRKNNIKIITHETNKGLAGARVTALNNANGDYILHVDSDDYITLDAVEKLVNAAKFSNADIIDAPFYNVSDDGDIISTNIPYKGTKIDYLHLLVSRTGLVNNQIWGKLIKTELYINNNINAIEGIDYGEDYCVFPRLLVNGEKYEIDDAIYYYNKGNTNSYRHTINEKNFVSYLSAEKVVYEYCKASKYGKQLQFSLDFGLANIFLFAYRNNVLNMTSIKNYNYNSKYFILNFYVLLFRNNSLNIFGHLLFVLIKNIKYIRLINN